MNQRKDTPRLLCSYLQETMQLLGCDDELAYLIADKTYSQFAARYMDGTRDMFEPLPGIGSEPAHYLEALDQLIAISYQPFVGALEKTKQAFLAEFYGEASELEQEQMAVNQ